MAIFKPESNGSSSDFTGICEFGIVGFKDKSNESGKLDNKIVAS